MKKVGEHIKDRNKQEWAIAGIYNHRNWIDYDLRNCQTGKVGSLRELKKLSKSKS